MLSSHTCIQFARRFFKSGKLLLHAFLLRQMGGTLAYNTCTAQLRTHILYRCAHTTHTLAKGPKLTFLLAHHILSARELLDLRAQVCNFALNFGNATSLARHFIILSALFECRHGIVKASNIVDVVEKVTKLCGDGVVISLGNDSVLREKDRACKTVGINAEQLLAYARGITRALAVGGKIIKREAVTALFCAKKALDAVFARRGGKLEASAIGAPLPRGIFFAFIFVKRLTTAGRHAVKHCFDKGGKCTLAPAVFLQENIQSLIKRKIEVLQFAKVFNV